MNAELLRELRVREKAANITPDPVIDAYMRATAVEGGAHSLRTETQLKLLDLNICADTAIGGPMLRGVSGGQRKRVTTGACTPAPLCAATPFAAFDTFALRGQTARHSCWISSRLAQHGLCPAAVCTASLCPAGEFLVGPHQVLMMDEISTGLDASTTRVLTQNLRNVAHEQRATVLVALLQPPPEVLELFDDVMLLSDGMVVFHGPVQQVGCAARACPPARPTLAALTCTESAMRERERTRTPPTRLQVVPFFSSLGFEPPARKGIADFLQVNARRQPPGAWKRPSRCPPEAMAASALTIAAPRRR